MPPQGCNLAVPGDKLYSSATRKTYGLCPGCANSFLSLNLAIKINTTYGNFTPLCFLVLFWRLQSKIAQFHTVKTFRQANTIKSSIFLRCVPFICHVVCTKCVLNLYASCSFLLHTFWYKSCIYHQKRGTNRSYDKKMLARQVITLALGYQTALLLRCTLHPAEIHNLKVVSYCSFDF